MLQRLRGQRGLAMMSVLAVIFVLVLLSVLVLYLSGKEIALTGIRTIGTQSLYIAEGGAYAARSALMVLMNAHPQGETRLHHELSGTTLAAWYAGGDPNAQNPLAILDYLLLNGQRYSINASAATESVTFDVNWALPETHRKLVYPAGASPGNPLGEGRYTATVTITRRLAPHPSDSAQPWRYVHRIGPDEYEFFYAYKVTSDGQVSPQARRRVTLAGEYSLLVRRPNFARYLLFSDVHTGPDGTALWFANMSNYDGPVHTNGEFRFAYYPKFGTPDPSTPCDTSRVRETPLTSAGTQAWFFNGGNPRRLAANENVIGGSRRDAPVLPDCTPGYGDDNDNPPANFTRGVARIEIPDNPYSQKGVSIGRDPRDTTAVSSAQIRAAIPELVNNLDPVPDGIYIPVTDADGNCRSDEGEPLRGGVYVQGDLSSLTLSVTGGSLATYTLVRGTRTVTITVDRANNRTTVTDTNWPAPPGPPLFPVCPGVPNGPATRVFSGVPKGWQGVGSNPNAAIIFVEGNILSLRGTLEEKEQTTIVADCPRNAAGQCVVNSGRIDITHHLRYEVPPVVTDPNSNPLNVLGLYSASNEIRIVTNTNDPETFNLDIHAMMMAGSRGDTFRSRIYNANWNATPVRGQLRLIGGLIGEYLGVMGVMNAAGQLIRGYGSDARFDRRMLRGFTPPYFPTTGLYEVSAAGLAGVRPVWREGAP